MSNLRLILVVSAYIAGSLNLIVLLEYWGQGFGPVLIGGFGLVSMFAVMYRLISMDGEA